jgi:hypothetical protein
MARTTGKSGFKLRSGNRPSFTKMRTFGIGPGTSPYKQKDDVDINELIKNQKTFEKGSPEWNKNQNKINEYYGDSTRHPVNGNENNTENTENTTKQEEEGKEVNNLMDTSADDASKKLKNAKRMQGLGKIAKNIGMIGVSALTGGLDEVYGTGKIQYGAGTVIKGDPKSKNKNLSADDVKKIVDQQMGK